jgi:hypothetical protein
LSLLTAATEENKSFIIKSTFIIISRFIWYPAVSFEIVKIYYQIQRRLFFIYVSVYFWSGKLIVPGFANDRAVKNVQRRVLLRVYNQYESFICLDLMVKNRKISIKRYFKWWISTKLV